MKTSTYHLGTVLVFLLASAVFFNTAWAMGSKGKDHVKDSAKAGEAYNWYDGDRQRTVWLNPHLLAEFSPGPADASAVRQAFPTAREVPSKQAAVRLWQLDGNAPANTAVTELRDGSPSGRFSPVFHDGSAGAGRKRALPGNIIVYFNPAWSPAQVEQWARDKQLAIVQQMRFGQNIYVIKTGPGLEALETANRLYESGNVVAAFPNWWQEVTTR